MSLDFFDVVVVVAAAAAALLFVEFIELLGDMDVPVLVFCFLCL